MENFVFIYLLGEAWNIFYFMTHIAYGKHTSISSGRTAGELKLWSCFWEVSWHGCRLPDFFPGCSVLQRGYKAKQAIAWFSISIDLAAPLSTLPTSSIPSPLLFQKIICNFEGEQYHLCVILLTSVWKWMETLNEAMLSFFLIGGLLLLSSFT